MKKTLISIILIAFVCNAFAQGPADAMLYSTNTYVGSARSLSMGNAFVALGGDIGAVAVNPASSAVFRHSEVAITPAVIHSGATSSTLGNTTNDSFASFNISNGGLVLAFDTNQSSGIFNFNFGVCFNKIADFNKMSSGNWTTGSSSMLSPIARSLQGVPESQVAYGDNYNPYTQSNLPWLNIIAYDSFLVSPYPAGSTDYIASTENGTPAAPVIGGQLNQDYFCKTVGGIQEFALNFGMNINDIVYVGANVNFQFLDYRSNSSYREIAKNTLDFVDGFKSMSSDYYLSTRGSGVNFEIGVIVTPVAGLRIGATFTTPTIYRLTDTWNYYMTSSFDNGNSYSCQSPTGSNNYRLNIPFRWSLGLAYTFEDFALISVDLESFNYSKLSMANAAGNKSDFHYENQRIQNGFRNSTNIRAGLEIRPADRWFIRGGYNLVASAGNLVDQVGSITYTYPKTHYGSLGLGYRFGMDRAFSIDFAYQRMLNSKEQYTAYSGGPTIDALNYTNKFLLTFAYRF